MLDNLMIEPIGKVQQGLVLEHTRLYIARAGEILGRKLPSVPVLFDLAGTTAGMYKVVGRQCHIRYNPWIFAKYFDENLTGTVPHEVAHFAIDKVYGLPRVKPHGVEWRALMHEFGADAGVTFNLDLTGIPQRRQGRHPYRCACRLHEISTTRHNRILRGKGIYHCRSCSAVLVYAD